MANIAQREEKRIKLAICIVIPAKKIFPPILAVFTFLMMEREPPPAWMRKVMTTLEVSD